MRKIGGRIDHNAGEQVDSNFGAKVDSHAGQRDWTRPTKQVVPAHNQRERSQSRGLVDSHIGVGSGLEHNESRRVDANQGGRRYRAQVVEKAPAFNADRIFRKSDVQKLMEHDPERYEAMADEIMAAYKTGRVR